MKKTMFILFVSLIALSAHAQLRNSTWSGDIKGDNPQKGILKFGSDTAILYAADKSVIETMKYSAKDGVLSLKKLSGQSDCDGTTVGKYKFTLTGGNITIMLAADNCSDRSSALDKTIWKKLKA